MVSIARNWWVMLLRGLAAIIFGILTIIWPALSLNVLVLMFGAYALIDGIFDLIAAARGERAGPRWATVLEGLAGIAAGIVTFIWTEAAAVALLVVIAAWAIVTGVLEIISAVRLRREIDNEWLLAIAGVLSIVLGVLLLLFPAAGLLTITFFIAGYAIAFGVLLVALAFRLRGWKQIEEAGEVQPDDAPHPVERPEWRGDVHPEDPYVRTPRDRALQRDHKPDPDQPA